MSSRRQRRREALAALPLGSRNHYAARKMVPADRFAAIQKEPEIRELSSEQRTKLDGQLAESSTWDALPSSARLTIRGAEVGLERRTRAQHPSVMNSASSAIGGVLTYVIAAAIAAAVTAFVLVVVGGLFTTDSSEFQERAAAPLAIAALAIAATILVLPISSPPEGAFGWSNLGWPARITLIIAIAGAALTLFISTAPSTVDDYCSYGATSVPQYRGCVDHVSREDVEAIDSNAARYARGEIDECLADAGPQCSAREPWFRVLPR